jgi:hypothetical protein
MLIPTRGAILISTYKKEKQVRSRESCVDTNATCKVPYSMRISAHYEYLRHSSHCCEKISQDELPGTTRLNLSLWTKVSRGYLAFYSHGSSIYNSPKRWLRKKRLKMPRSSSHFPFAADFHMFISSIGISSTIITAIIPPTNHPPLTSPHLT